MQIFPARPEQWKQNLRRQKIGINRKVLAKLLCREHNDLKIGSLKGALPRKNNRISRDTDEFRGRTMMDERKWQEKTVEGQDNGPSDPFTFLKLVFWPCINREEAQLDMQREKGEKIDISRAAPCGSKVQLTKKKTRPIVHILTSEGLI